MSTLQEFTLFPAFPKEIRLMIWEYTLIPRLLPFRCIPQGRRAYANNLHTVLFDSQYRAPSLAVKRERVSKIVRLSLDTVEPLPALSTCRESRDVALTHGYESWKLQNEKEETKNVIWNPALDIVGFVEPHPHWIPCVYTEIFDIQYPGKAEQIRNLALPTSNWFWFEERRTAIVERWVKFKNLRQLIVVLDLPFERKTVEQRGNLRPPWDIPNDIEAHLRRSLENKSELQRKIPSIRVVEREQAILGNESIQLRLRCNPCEALNKYTLN